MHALKLRDFEGRHVSTKALLGSETKTRALLEGTKENILPDYGFYLTDKKADRKYRVGDQTWRT